MRHLRKWVSMVPHHAWHWWVGMTPQQPWLGLWTPIYPWRHYQQLIALHCIAGIDAITWFSSGGPVTNCVSCPYFIQPFRQDVGFVDFHRTVGSKCRPAHRRWRASSASVPKTLGKCNRQPHRPDGLRGTLSVVMSSHPSCASAEDHGAPRCWMEVWVVNAAPALSMTVSVSTAQTRIPRLVIHRNVRSGVLSVALGRSQQRCVRRWAGGRWLFGGLGGLGALVAEVSLWPPAGFPGYQKCLKCVESFQRCDRFWIMLGQSCLRALFWRTCYLHLKWVLNEFLSMDWNGSKSGFVGTRMGRKWVEAHFHPLQTHFGLFAKTHFSVSLTGSVIVF